MNATPQEARIVDTPRNITIIIIIIRMLRGAREMRATAEHGRRTTTG